MRRYRTAITVAAAMVAATALCSCTSLLGQTSPDDIAHDSARKGAERLATEIDDARIRNVLASDLASQYSDPGGSSWQRASGTGAELTAEPVSWDGMTRDAGGARFVLRINAHVDGGGWGRPSGDWSGCFAFRAFAFFAYRDTTADEVTCPPTASSPPSARPRPALPADAADLLSAVLATATEKSLAADLKAAFPDGSVRSDPVSGAHLIRDSGAEGPVLAAAIGISGTTDCQVGKRDRDGTVHVWRPQKITLQAGEAGCTIGNALHPVSTH